MNLLSLSCGSNMLFRHPSFWAEGSDDDLIVTEDAKMIATEQSVFACLATCCTAFVPSLEDATVNCGAVMDVDAPCSLKGGCRVMRLRSQTQSGEGSHTRRLLAHALGTFRS